jgi:hypothetical protein
VASASTVVLRKASNWEKEVVNSGEARVVGFLNARAGAAILATNAGGRPQMFFTARHKLEGTSESWENEQLDGLPNKDVARGSIGALEVALPLTYGGGIRALELGSFSNSKAGRRLLGVTLSTDSSSTGCGGY